jgi:predicted ATP-dependent endonuclease of OLD family
MLLKKVEINKYKSYVEPQEFIVEDGITRIVGKNESGKTALLEALAKFNYFDKKSPKKFDSVYDYPRNRVTEYNLLHETGKSEIAVTCTFTLDDDIIKRIETEFGTGIISTPSIILSVDYDNQLNILDLNLDFSAFIKHINNTYNPNKVLIDDIATCIGFDALKSLCLTHPEELKEINDLLTRITTSNTGVALSSYDPLAKYIYHNYIRENLPKFWYFDEYYSLPSRVSFDSIINNTPGELTPEEFATIKALFELTHLDIHTLNENNYESFMVALETTSNNITDEMFRYWTTNKDLEIKIKCEHAQNGKKYLNIRIYNREYRLTLPLKNRSKGFLWFFSFLVWFNRLQGKNGSTYILLLDEPGLNLHASAQADLLKFIDEVLAPKYQVLYTTHSPFMIDPAKLNEVRTVYDSLNRNTGSIISDALHEKDSGTLFPLQAALGYDLAQNLFISPKNLLVEGVSDFIYLSTISEELKANDKIGLDSDITIVPVGGLDKVATFISLLNGQKLSIACLLDTPTDNGTKQKLTDLTTRKIIKDKNIKFCDQFAGLTSKNADMEDIFFRSDYLNLFNDAFTGTYPIINDKDILDSEKSIVPQITKIINKDRYNHYIPAMALLRATDKSQYLSSETLDKFSRVFEDINSIFSK